MKVKVQATIDVDVEAWIADYGCTRNDVRSEVVKHFMTALQDAYGVKAGLATVSPQALADGRSQAGLG